MMNGLRSELYKLFHARIFWVLLLITAVMSFVMTGLIFLDEKGLLMEQVTVETGEETLEGFPMFIESVLAPDTFFIYAFGALLSSFFIASEYTNGTIKNIVSTGAKRITYYINKFLSVWLGTMFVYACTVLTFTLFTSMFFGIGTLPTAEEWTSAFKALVMTIVLMGGFCAITTLFAILVRSSSVAIFVLFGMFLVCVVGLDMLASKYMLFEEIRGYSVFHYMGLIPMENHTNPSFIWEVIQVTIGTCIVFFSIGMVLFQRKDIQ